MIFNNNYYYTLRDSKDNFYKLNLSDNNYLFFHQLDKSRNLNMTPFKKDVLDFSVDMDKNDKIHLVYINKLGELIYSIFPLINSEKKLTIINLKIYIIKYLTLKIINNDIHIFYMLCSKHNKTTWAIYHSLWHDGSWSTKKVTDVTCQKFIYPYMIDHNSKNLYLFFSKDSNTSYSIKKFNLDFYMWGDLDDKLDIHGSHNISFLINSNNVGILCYNASFNKNIITVIRYRDLNNSSSYWSNDIFLSKDSLNSVHPCIVSQKNATYILWEEGQNICYRKSEFGTTNWSEKKVITTKSDNLSNSIYISNHKQDLDLNTTFIPVINGNPPQPLINFENISHKKNNFLIHKTSREEDSFMPMIPNIVSEISTKENYIRELQLILIDKDKIIGEYNKVNLKLKEEITNLRENLNNITNQYEEKNLDIKSKASELNNLTEEYNVSLQSLTEEKNKLISTYKDEIDSLLLTVGEKDSAITRLNKLINTLYEDISQKEAQIEALEKRLNKGLINKIFKA